MTSGDSNKKLRQAIHFTEADLSMNQQGKLAPSQIEYLKKGMFDPSKWNKFMAGLMAGGFFLLIIRDGLQVLTLQFVLPYAGFCLMAYFLYSLYFKNNAKKLEEGKYKVETLEGIVTVPQDQNGSQAMSLGQYGTAINMGERFSGMNMLANRYEVQIGEKKLYTTKPIQEVFENGKHYKIHLLRTSQQEHQNVLLGAVIVSAESPNESKEDF